MNEEEILAHVRERADLESTAEARCATETTLRVLGARLAEPEAENLAAQLPDSLGAALTWESATEAEPFDVDAFVDRVRDGEATDDRLDEDDAEKHATAVVTVLADAVTRGEAEDVRAQLPGDYDRLFKPATGSA